MDISRVTYKIALVTVISLIYWVFAFGRGCSKRPCRKVPYNSVALFARPDSAVIGS
jgi:hypothetical protein